MKPQAIVAIFLFSLLVSASLSAKTKLVLGQGVMKAGGHMHMPITIPKQGATHVGLNVSPNFDYFVTRNLSLGIKTSVERASITSEHLPWSFMLGLGSTYHFDLGPIYPYVGLHGGLSWKTKISGMNFLLSFPAGFLVALNSHVALDFGVPVKLLFNKDGYLGMVLPVGYLGVQAFF